MTMISMISMILLTQVESNGGSFCDRKNTPKPKKTRSVSPPSSRVARRSGTPGPFFPYTKYSGAEENKTHVPAKCGVNVLNFRILSAIFPMAGFMFFFKAK